MLERRRPRHDLEAEAVVDHRDATGSEVEALTIDAGDMLARRSLQMRQASVGREPRRGGVEVATAQGIQEIALQEDYKTSSTPVAAPAALARQYGGCTADKDMLDNMLYSDRQSTRLTFRHSCATRMTYSS